MLNMGKRNVFRNNLEKVTSVVIEFRIENEVFIVHSIYKSYIIKLIKLSAHRLTIEYKLNQYHHGIFRSVISM